MSQSFCEYEVRCLGGHELSRHMKTATTCWHLKDHNLTRLTTAYGSTHKKFHVVTSRLIYSYYSYYYIILGFHIFSLIAGSFWGESHDFCSKTLRPEFVGRPNRNQKKQGPNLTTDYRAGTYETLTEPINSGYRDWSPDRLRSIRRHRTWNLVFKPGFVLLCFHEFFPIFFS